MGVTSLQHAERMIRSGVKNGGIIGSADRLFMDALFYSCAPPNDHDLKLVHRAIDDMERGRKIQVQRHPGSGTILSVCEYGVSVEQVAHGAIAVKPTLRNYELLVEMHCILKSLSTGGNIFDDSITSDEFVDMLYASVSERFQVDKNEFLAVFGAMTRLDLRGNVKSVRGRGMAVADVVLSIGVSPEDPPRAPEEVNSEVARLKAEIVRLQSQTVELSSRLHDAESECGRLQGVIVPLDAANAELIRQLEQSEQTCGDLTRRNEHLAQFEKYVRTAVEEFDKN